MIAVIGLIMFAVSSYLALSKKMHLMVPFVVVPVIAGLFCGFSLPEVLNFAAEGVTGTFNSVLLCIFAVLYFSVLSETGMFDIMVNLAAAPMTAMAWGQPAKMTVFDPSIDPVVMASSLYPVVAIMLGLAVVTSLGFGYY